MYGVHPYSKQKQTTTAVGINWFIFRMCHRQISLYEIAVFLCGRPMTRHLRRLSHELEGHIYISYKGIRGLKFCSFSCHFSGFRGNGKKVRQFKSWVCGRGMNACSRGWKDQPVAFELTSSSSFLGQKSLETASMSNAEYPSRLTPEPRDTDSLMAANQMEMKSNPPSYQEPVPPPPPKPSTTSHAQEFSIIGGRWFLLSVLLGHANSIFGLPFPL